MKFSVLTLFPEAVEAYCHSSIIGRGQQAGLISVESVNPREFTTDAHKKVDEPPYGGGAGMVMTCQPIDEAFQSLQPLESKTTVLLTTPVGPVFNQSMAQNLAKQDQVVILCGHYEGIDHRVFDFIPNLQPVSIGDFVLTGGELPALCILDAVSRYVPGVVQKSDSVREDSFSNGLLEHPHYTKPRNYKGYKVPEVLLSGHHGNINQWRQQQAIANTQQYRPDLLK